MVSYDDLLGNILKYGNKDFDEAAFHFLQHCNPTKEQRSSILRLFKPTHAGIGIPKRAKKVNINHDEFSASYPPFKPMCRKDDPKGRITGIRDLTDPFFMAKRDAILRECREVLGDDYDRENCICPHCGLPKPCH